MARRVPRPRGRRRHAGAAGKSARPDPGAFGHSSQLIKEGDEAKQAVDDARRQTTSRRQLDRNARFQEMSPEVGVLDEQAALDALRDDLDESLSLIADMSRATDEKLRALARRLAGRVVVDLSRGDGQPSRGIDRLARRPLASGGDLDLEASAEAIVDARAARSLVEVDRLVARSWVRREHALCLLVDRSGSMEGERLVSAALAAAAMACRAPTDHSVLAFATDVIVVKAQDQDRPVSAVVDDILSLRGFGTTDLALALRAAQAQLARSRANRRVGILLSDGRATAGDDPLAAARSLDVLHVIAPAGEDVAEAEALARAGGGRLVTVAGPGEIPEAVLRLLR